MKYLEVGKIIATHGIKGEVKVSLSTSFPFERFSKGNTLYIENGEKYDKIVIDGFRIHKGLGLVLFNGYNNINEVLNFVGKSIYVDKETLEALEEDDFYYDDLIGLIAKDNQGNIIGEVIDILDVPQGAILMIKKQDKGQALVPFVEEFIDEVNIKDKYLVIIPIEGLL